MIGRTSKSEARDTWESAAPGWVKWETRFSAGLEDATTTLLDMADVKSGARVLDIACGGGYQTLRAAQRVGPTGVVVASDISAAMLEHVRHNASQQGIVNIETMECAVEELDESLPSFDGSICRLGLHLFPSPSGALSAIRRVLKPGARFAGLVFTTPDSNPFMAQPMRILLHHAGKQPPLPGQPGMFSLGGEGMLDRLLKDSGFKDVRTTVVRAPLTLPGADDALEMMRQAFGAYRAVVAELDDARQSRAWADVSDCLRQFEIHGRFETELEFVVGSGAN